MTSTTIRRSYAVRPWLVVMVAIVVAVGLRVADANPAAAQTAMVKAWRVDADPGLDATSGVWRDLPGTQIALTAQDVAYPQGPAPVVPTVTVRALHTADTLFVAVSWQDETVNDTTVAAEDYTDAVAVQFPSRAGSAVPAACMGQADNGVNIWHWRADSQRGLPSGPPSGYVDGYPSTDALFHPARAAGNPLAAVDVGAVQNLVAGGFGTLSPVGEQTVEGSGTHDGSSWSTVFKRRYRAPGELQPTFADGRSTDVAFAIWDGEKDQRDGIKSVTSFVRLNLSSEGAPVDRPLLRALGWVLYGAVLSGVVAAILSRPRRLGSRS